MVERHRVMLGNIDPDLWARVKAEAALAKKPVHQWVAEVLAQAAEDAEDVRDAEQSLADPGGWLTLEEMKRELKDAGKLPRRGASASRQGRREPARKREAEVSASA